jgi:DNA-binding protein H-NS
MIDLETLSLADLKKLKKDVDTAIAHFADRERRKALAEVEAFARERGLSASDLADLVQRKTRKPAEAKYANPADPSQTWTGRGRKPGWVNDALASGKSIDDLLI